MPPRKSTRVVSTASSSSAAAATSAPARPSRGRKTATAPAVVEPESDHVEDEEEAEAAAAKPKRRTATRAAAPAKSVPTTTRAKRGAKAAPVEEDQEDQEEEEEEEVAPKAAPSRSRGRGSKKVAVKVAPDAEDAEQDDTPQQAAEPGKATDGEQSESPEPLPKKARISKTGKGKKVSLPVEPELAAEAQEEDTEATLAAKPISKSSKGRKGSPPVPEAEVPAISAASDAEEEAQERTEDEEDEADVIATLEAEEAAEKEQADAKIEAPIAVSAEESAAEDEGDETMRLDGPLVLDTPHAASQQTMPPPSQSRATPLTAEPTASSSSIPAEPTPPKGPTPRLTIHKLVLVNFKSYAGRQEIGPFHKSFSAIVGPNGSGKSNTIDALLFVFGYRASKMRQGKLSELIHNSAGKEGLENCSVEVWFREIVDLPGKDNFLLVPNSQLIVTRTAYKNNSSRYSINNRFSTFTEVTTLLKGKGIDLDHNRFLILQGEVESIALMKPKAQTEHEDGLLEYLEDIIGTTKYKEPIEQADKEREELDEQRGEKMNRLKVVEREKAALEEKKREAEHFLRDSNELTRKKSLLWQHHMQQLQDNIKATAEAVEKLTAGLAQEQEANAHHLAEIESLQKDYTEKLADFEEVKKFADQLVKDSKKFEKEEVGLSEKKKHLGQKAKKFKKSLQEDGHARSEATAANENFASELATNRSKVSELEKKLVVEEAELDEIRDNLKDKTDVFTQQIEVKQRELEPWTAKISEKQSAIDVATSERDLLVQKATSVQAALEEAKARVQQIKEGDGEKQAEYAQLNKEKGKLERAVQRADARVQEINAQIEELRSKVSAQRAKTDEAKSSLVADRTENAVLASLNKLKAQGRIKGFHGRLGDLGTIDDKYDIAVTTACGSLNNLVVDTVEQGQACIEHLRKGNVGRASFMVLEKLPARDLSRIETPEGVPRLFDLIKPKDTRFAPAFFKGVFNTLVAEDLAQAQRIGYGKKRWRVVTLAGQLIDPSGTMSGGGTRVQKGGMSSKLAGDKVAPEVVAKYEHDLALVEAELQALLNDRREVEVEMSAFKKRLPEVELGLDKLEMEVQGGEKRIAEAEKRLAELKAQNKPDAADEKRIKALETEIETLTKACNKLKMESQSISDEIKSLQQKILDVGGVKLRAIQSKVSTTKGLLDLANDAITKAEVGQAKAVRDVEKLSRAIESNTAKLEEVDAELAVVQGDLDAVTGDLASIRAKVQEAVEASGDVQEELAGKKKELDEKNGEINKFRKLEMDYKQKIEDGGKMGKDCKRKYDHWRARHEELELVYVDEDDEEEEEAEGEQAKNAADDADIDAKPTVDENGNAFPAKTGKGKRSKGDSMELVEYTPDELAAVDKDMLNAEITQLEEEIGRAKPNLSVLNEYRKREAEYLERASDMETVTASRDAAKLRYDELRNVRLKEFMAGFHAISAKLKEMYQMITMGGNAEIELIDSMDPFSEGVVLSIMPPKKSWRAIANLSGGEKTLASLALVFALHVFKPTPLYFMDEIDAALDFKNVSIVANYIQSKTQAAQFIVISLRNDMFELAHRLVGIYKTSNCTKSIAIDNKDLKSQAKPPAPVPKGILRPGYTGTGTGHRSGSALDVASTPAPTRTRTQNATGTSMGMSVGFASPSLSNLVPPGAMDAISSTPQVRRLLLAVPKSGRRGSALSVMSPSQSQSQSQEKKLLEGNEVENIDEGEGDDLATPRAIRS